jgi:hypothetical protein
MGSIFKLIIVLGFSIGGSYLILLMLNFISFKKKGIEKHQLKNHSDLSANQNSIPNRIKKELK